MTPRYKPIAMAFLIILAIWGVFTFFVVWPQLTTNWTMHSDNDDMRKDLQRQGVTSTSPAKLTGYRENLRGMKQAVRQNMRGVYNRAVADAQFGRLIRSYDTIDGFRLSVKTYTYQRSFLELKRNLAEKNIHLYEPIFGLSENSNSPATYQLVAELWIVEELANLAESTGLDLSDRDFQMPETKPDGTPWTKPDGTPWQGRLPAPARITALPVMSYSVASDVDPYLEEYPVRMTVTGTMDQVCQFIRGLTAEGRFIPLKNISLTRKDLNSWKKDEVEATLECSAFLILSDDIEKLLPTDMESDNHNLPTVWTPGH